MKHLVTTILIFMWCGVATAQKEVKPLEGCRKNLRIDEFLLSEDAIAAKRSFSAFRSALLGGNRERVIAMIEFPADLVLNGYGTKFDSAQQFLNKYDEFFTAYVTESVRHQNPEELLAGWAGVSLSDGAVTFERGNDGVYRVKDIRPKPVKLPNSIAEFLDHRLTCPPVVAEGRIVAYDWATHKAPGFENIYIDHLIFDVTNVLRGDFPQTRIRVDFWGVTHLPDYNLPNEVFEPGSIWRMYLRPEGLPPSNEEVCRKGVQETISNVDETGRELWKESAIKILAGEDSLTFAALPCFEVSKQLLSKANPKGTDP